MDDKTRFDALMSLAKFRVEIREKRREIEWKVSLGLWGLLAAASAYLTAHSTLPLIILLVAWVLLVLAHAFFWVRTNYNSSERDARIAYYHAETAEKIVLEASPDPGPRPQLTQGEKCWGFLRHQPIWFEILATALLGLVVIVASQVLASPALGPLH